MSTPKDYLSEIFTRTIGVTDLLEQGEFFFISITTDNSRI